MRYVGTTIALLLCVHIANFSNARMSSRDGTRSRGRQNVALRERDHSLDVCELEISCKAPSSSMSDEDDSIEDANYSTPVRLPIRGPRGPRGPQGEKGDRGSDGLPGLPGPPGSTISTDRRVAFFVGLTENFGPVTEHTNIIFDRIITNIGSAYNTETGKFTSPAHGVYQFNVVISAQGRQKAAVMVLKNGEMVATVWAESIPYWSTASNVAVLELERGDQVWLLLLSRASYLHGYMYTTFSGTIVIAL